MQFFDWLTENRVSLTIRLECEFDPTSDGQEWRCTIQGRLVPSLLLPAYFIVNRSGRDVIIQKRASNPEDALRDAVHQLRGLRIKVISKYAERRETLTIPQDLTV